MPRPYKISTSHVKRDAELNKTLNLFLQVRLSRACKKVSSLIFNLLPENAENFSLSSGCRIPKGNGFLLSYEIIGNKEFHGSCWRSPVPNYSYTGHLLFATKPPALLGPKWDIDQSTLFDLEFVRGE